MVPSDTEVAYRFLQPVRPLDLASATILGSALNRLDIGPTR